jgi:hypothetical protein
VDCGVWSDAQGGCVRAWDRMPSNAVSTKAPLFCFPVFHEPYGLPILQRMSSERLRTRPMTAADLCCPGAILPGPAPLQYGPASFLLCRNVYGIMGP